MIPIIIVSIALPVCFAMVVFSCINCFQRKKPKFETFHNRFADVAQNNPSFTIDIPEAPVSSSEHVSIEPLPGILTKSSVALPVRPKITCLDSSQQGATLSLVSIQRSFPREQIQYINEVETGWFGKVLDSEASKIVSGSVKSRVMVKMLKDDATKLEQKQFLDEVLAFRCIEHVNVLSLMGQCVETSPFLVILEYAPHGNLKAFLNHHRLELEALAKKHRLLSFAVDAASGLASLHKHGYIHNDISARNCVIMSDYSLKIGDYGISDVLYKEDYMLSGSELLPIRWMAPETLIQTQGIWTSQHGDLVSDIWSFGVLLWEIFSMGERPYNMLTDEAVLQGVVLDKLIQPAELDGRLTDKEKLWQVMSQCWTEPTQRVGIDTVYQQLDHLTSARRETLDLSSDFEDRWRDLAPNQLASSSTDSNLGSRLGLAGSFAGSYATSASSSSPPSPGTQTTSAAPEFNKHSAKNEAVQPPESAEKSTNKVAGDEIVTPKESVSEPFVPRLENIGAGDIKVNHSPDTTDSKPSVGQSDVPYGDSFQNNDIRHKIMIGDQDYGSSDDQINTEQEVLSDPIPADSFHSEQFVKATSTPQSQKSNRLEPVGIGEHTSLSLVTTPGGVISETSSIYTSPQSNITSPVALSSSTPTKAADLGQSNYLSPLSTTQGSYYATASEPSALSDEEHKDNQLLNSVNSTDLSYYDVLDDTVVELQDQSVSNDGHLNTETNVESASIDTTHATDFESALSHSSDFSFELQSVPETMDTDATKLELASKSEAFNDEISDAKTVVNGNNDATLEAKAVVSGKQTVDLTTDLLGIENMSSDFESIMPVFTVDDKALVSNPSKSIDSFPDQISNLTTSFEEGSQKVNDNVGQFMEFSSAQPVLSEPTFDNSSIPGSLLSDPTGLSLTEPFEMVGSPVTNAKPTTAFSDTPGPQSLLDDFLTLPPQKPDSGIVSAQLMPTFENDLLDSPHNGFESGPALSDLLGDTFSSSGLDQQSTASEKVGTSHCSILSHVTAYEDSSSNISNNIDNVNENLSKLISDSYLQECLPVLSQPSHACDTPIDRIEEDYADKRQCTSHPNNSEKENHSDNLKNNLSPIEEKTLLLNSSLFDKLNLSSNNSFEEDHGELRDLSDEPDFFVPSKCQPNIGELGSPEEDITGDSGIQSTKLGFYSDSDEDEDVGSDGCAGSESPGRDLTPPDSDTEVSSTGSAATTVSSGGSTSTSGSSEREYSCDTGQQYAPQPKSPKKDKELSPDTGQQAAPLLDTGQVKINNNGPPLDPSLFIMSDDNMSEEKEETLQLITDHYRSKGLKSPRSFSALPLTTIHEYETLREPQLRRQGSLRTLSDNSSLEVRYEDLFGTDGFEWDDDFYGEEDSLPSRGKTTHQTLISSSPNDMSDWSMEPIPLDRSKGQHARPSSPDDMLSDYSTEPEYILQTAAAQINNLLNPSRVDSSVEQKPQLKSTRQAVNDILSRTGLLKKADKDISSDTDIATQRPDPAPSLLLTSRKEPVHTPTSSPQRHPHLSQSNHIKNHNSMYTLAENFSFDSDSMSEGADIFGSSPDIGNIHTDLSSDGNSSSKDEADYTVYDTKDYQFHSIHPQNEDSLISPLMLPHTHDNAETSLCDTDPPESSNDGHNCLPSVNEDNSSSGLDNWNLLGLEAPVASPVLQTPNTDIISSVSTEESSAALVDLL